uniref:Benomyl/methotrexate resistance protein n=1 Tax=Coccidioides posadasii RMSCC 3488 TaxID=454284 RepID=A0A0J6FH29_COCPO|nr:benomyl/methotrexate resistance protein [Coccidioides posadasii RMSCC 3488]
MTVNAADVETGSHPQTSHGSEITSEIAAQESLQTTPEKSNIVDWDGPDDPQNPINWSSVRRWMTITIVSVVTFLNGFGSTVFAPSVPEVMHEFNIDSGALSSFTVSVFAIGWAVGPLVLPPLSELYGRNPLYHASNLFLTLSSMACALSSNLTMLIVFRFFMGLAGCPSLSLSGGTIADLIPLERRGVALSVWGPIVGGFMTDSTGWRWVFWMMTIAPPTLKPCAVIDDDKSGTLTIISLLLLRETYAPVILGRKASQLRQETGNMELTTKYDKGETPGYLFKMAILRPTKLLLFSPIVFLMALKITISYGYSYFLFTTFPFVFGKQYGFKPSSIGLVYIGIGIGYVVTQIIAALFSDRYIARMKRANANGPPKPEMGSSPLAWCIVCTATYYADAMYVCMLVPIFGTALIGARTLCYFFSIMAYLIDTYTIYSASAISANIVLDPSSRDASLAGTRLYETLGIGWGTSLLAFIALALAPIPFFLLKYGERIRTHPRFQVKL